MIGAIAFLLSGCTLGSPTATSTISTVEGVLPSPSPSLSPSPEVALPTGSPLTLFGLDGVRPEDVYSIMFSYRPEDRDAFWRATDTEMIADILQFIGQLSLAQPQRVMFIGGGFTIDIQVNGRGIPVTVRPHFPEQGPMSISLPEAYPDMVFPITDGAWTWEEWESLLEHCERVR